MLSGKKRVLALLAGLACLYLTLSIPAAADADGASPLPAADTLRLTEEHVCFISGYDDGSFRPDSPLTRAEACAMLLKLLPAEFQSAEVSHLPEQVQPSSSAEAVYDGVDNDGDKSADSSRSETVAGYTDGQSGAQPAEPESEPWYAGAVSAMSELGLLLPDDSGSLRPEQEITRAEFTAMIAGFYSPYPAEAHFTDLSAEHPFYAEIACAADRGWVSGYDDGSFRPDEPLTRAEAVTLLCRVLGRGGDANAADYHLRRFTDLPPEHWAFFSVAEASVPHTPVTDGNGDELWTDYPELRLEPGLMYEGGELYCISPDTGWYIENETVNGFCFGPDGRYTSGNAELDGYVKHTLAQLSQEGMTREELLHAAFNYTRDSFSYLRRSYYETGHTGWEMENALVMFQTRRGNCYCYASVFYYLARQLGYEATAVAGGVGYSLAPHGWVEIDFDGVNNIFDPELEMSYRAKGVYYYDFYMMPYSRTPWPYVGPSPALETDAAAAADAVGTEF